jgi:hypothetical protein
MQDFHTGASTIYKNENFSVLHIPSHLVGYHPAQGIKTAPHICWVRIQIILHRGGEAEHATGALIQKENVTCLHQACRLVLYKLRWVKISHSKSVHLQLAISVRFVPVISELFVPVISVQTVPLFNKMA